MTTNDIEMVATEMKNYHEEPKLGMSDHADRLVLFDRSDGSVTHVGSRIDLSDL